ncbi:MAG TPA: NUDIX domain-containing protein [Candidatus Paceibacterota bacterium]|nr:NUDIX domain-containing protein [Candidatus Paceibacterota bacterium]
MKERYKIIPEVFLLLIVDGKILLSRRFQTGYEDGNYGLPAGHGEDRETMREGVAREAREEIGIEINLDDLDFRLVQNRWCDDPENPHARIGFYFTARTWKGEPTNKEPDKCDDLDWFSLDKLPQNIVPHVRATIESYCKGLHYSEYAWPVKE